MRNKLLVYLVYHDEKLFVNDALCSVLLESSSTLLDFVIIDTSKSSEVDEYLRSIVPEEVEIFKFPDILVNVVGFVFDKFASDYQYIVRLDADDQFLPGSITDMLEVLEKDQNAAAVYGGWKLIDNNSNYIADVEPPSPLSLQGFHGACTMFKTSALKKFDIRHLNITSQDGFAIYMHLHFSDWNVIALPYALFNYRRHSNNLSTNRERLWSSRLKILRHYVQRTKVNSSILIDCELEDFGNGDSYFLGEKTLIKHIKSGWYRDQHGSDPIPEGNSLTQFIKERFQYSSQHVVAINLNKIKEAYFDGLIEYICLIGSITNTHRVYFTRLLDTTVWTYKTGDLVCENRQLLSSEKIINYNLFYQVHGLNYFSFDESVESESFIATDNLFVKSVEIYE